VGSRHHYVQTAALQRHGPWPPPSCTGTSRECCGGATSALAPNKNSNKRT
jgi:hypothetical protein